MEFRKLDVYKRSIRFVKDVYELSKVLPAHENFGVTSQLRRAAVSVVLNIAEGSGASSSQEFARFLDMSRRSLYEVDALLEIMVTLNYCKKSQVYDIYQDRIVLGKMLSQFIKKLRT